jgi:hypothetical protein
MHDTWTVHALLFDSPPPQIWQLAQSAASSENAADTNTAAAATTAEAATCCE